MYASQDIYIYRWVLDVGLFILTYVCTYFYTFAAPDGLLHLQCCVRVFCTHLRQVYTDLSTCISVSIHFILAIVYILSFSYSMLCKHANVHVLIIDLCISYVMPCTV